MTLGEACVLTGAFGGPALAFVGWIMEKSMSPEALWWHRAAMSGMPAEEIHRQAELRIALARLMRVSSDAVHRGQDWEQAADAEIAETQQALGVYGKDYQKIVKSLEEDDILHQDAGAVLAARRLRSLSRAEEPPQYCALLAARKRDQAVAFRR
jgi:hypothetical protein